MKATNWKQYLPAAIYLAIALVWALSAGLSEALITHNFAETSKRQQQHGLIQQYYASLQRGDLAKTIETVTDDVRVQIPQSLPFGGLYEGHEGVKKFLGMLNHKLPLTTEIRQLIDTGSDEVLALVTIKNPASRILNAAQTEFSFVEVFRLQDGRIRERRVFASDEPIVRQLPGR